MSVDISGFGSIITLTALPSLPLPYPVTQFADDSDPFDIPVLKIAEVYMGNNGELLKASKASAIIITLNIIPNSIDDRTLSVLFENNRVGKGKLFSISDLITLSCLYPDGRFINLTSGYITDGMPGTSFASSGRLKTKSYSFAFENKVGS